MSVCGMPTGWRASSTTMIRNSANRSPVGSQTRSTQSSSISRPRSPEVSRMTDLHVGDQVRTGIIAMEQYYKAVRPDGTSFYDQHTGWELGKITRHPSADLDNHDGDPARYLSVSVSPTDCTGFRWPARLFRVAPVRGHKVITPRPDLPNKRASDAWKPVEDLPAHQLFGPQGVHVAALIDRSQSLTASEIDA